MLLDKKLELVLSMNKLSIVIPTCNRALYLDHLLGVLANYVVEIPFDLIICNNGSTDNTENVIDKWKSQFPIFTYVAHQQNMGFDYNVSSGYYEVKTDYCWLLGDTVSISKETLCRVVDIIKDNTIDALIINRIPPVSIPSRIYTEINSLLTDLGWHITYLSSCIISNEFLNKSYLKRYQGTYFVQYGTFIEHLCQKGNFIVKWENTIMLDQYIIPRIKKHGWLNTPFEVFGKLWFKTVMSLPNQIKLEVKEKVLCDHNTYTKIFSLTNCLKSKLINGKGYAQDYKKNRKYVQWVTNKMLWKYDMIMAIPDWVGYIFCKIVGIK